MLRCSLAVVICMAIQFAGADEDMPFESYRALTSDMRSSRLGEPVIILVAEATVAESSAGTEFGKGVSLRASSNDNGAERGFGVGLSGQDKGAGQTIRRGRAVTQISATITEILASDMLRIEGKKVLNINGEDQVITVAGVIRRSDIDSDNSIESSRISDAAIDIHGEGELSEAQRKSIIFRVLRWLRIL